ncbi:hypothetical protein A2V49_04140 [candidate division WWE3 bacterium RBG_19FT_COMBO_34_6]|uniref:Uncharacterized protein n=1 Tax=candidate division WWE3 bacterium RBG_19FT_COMBO_34_6 TaxID=1802612 RepID=A0A1F4ULM9_UNCKA|nr:MAG: hypothetical protein A2V49_04140 [candidate division WWE3 bacterium RBG_19FT_COMBO_34_6]
MLKNTEDIFVGDIFHDNSLAYKIEKITKSKEDILVIYSLSAHFVPSTKGPAWFAVVSHPYENSYENFVKLYPHRLEANKIVYSLQVGEKENLKK